MSNSTTYAHSGTTRTDPGAALTPDDPPRPTERPWTFWIPFAVTGFALTLLLGALAVLSYV